MAIPHAQSGELIDVRPFGDSLPEHTTRALVKTDHLEIIRMVLPAGKEIQEHQTPREIIVQCIEGRIEFTCHGQTQTLEPGRMLYLDPGQSHSLRAAEDSSMLLTLLLQPK